MLKPGGARTVTRVAALAFALACCSNEQVAAKSAGTSSAPATPLLTSADAPDVPLRVRLREGGLLCVKSDDTTWIREADGGPGLTGTVGYCGGYQALASLWAEAQNCVSMQDADC